MLTYVCGKSARPVESNRIDLYYVVAETCFNAHTLRAKNSRKISQNVLHNTFEKQKNAFLTLILSRNIKQKAILSDVLTMESSIEQVFNRNVLEECTMIEQNKRDRQHQRRAFRLISTNFRLQFRKTGLTLNRLCEKKVNIHGARCSFHEQKQ